MKNRPNFLLSIFILGLLINISCEGGRGSEERKNRDATQTNSISSDSAQTNQLGYAELPLDATVKIYFENTLSMDGYINGNTGFKDVFRELLVNIENEDIIDFTTEFYLVNNKLTPENFGVQTTKISEGLSPKSTGNKGNKSVSNFEDVLDKVLENQNGDIISIVMADFIYSPEKGENAPSALNKLKTYTKEAFLKAGIQDQKLETRVYRFTSDFHGTYFDINNKHIKGIAERPYYYFVIAPNNLMTVFEKEIAPQLEKQPGYQDKVTLSPQTYSDIPKEVLTATGINGRINTQEGLQVMTYPRQGNLEFLLVLDLQKIPVEESYILNKENYSLKNNQFQIKDIGIKNGKKIIFQNKGEVAINPTDQLKTNSKNYTHAILISSEGMVSEDLHFSLKKKIPAWVAAKSSDDDRRIKNDSLEQTKTFGFFHLIMGISEAYQQKTDGNEYFSLTIPVKTN